LALIEIGSNRKWSKSESALIDGPLAALLRRATYLYRMPTDEHRAKLALNWAQQSAQFAVEEGPAILRSFGVPVPNFPRT